MNFQEILPSIPDPLHPFTVHFPVVLIIIGTLFAIVGLIFKSSLIARACALQLTLGAAGVQWAIYEGDKAAKAFLDRFPGAKNTFEQHTYWAEILEYFSIAAAVIAILAWIFCKRTPLSIWLRLLNASTATALLFVMAVTAHFGGYMVYSDALGLSSEPAALFDFESTDSE